MMDMSQEIDRVVIDSGRVDEVCKDPWKRHAPTQEVHQQQGLFCQATNLTSGRSATPTHWKVSAVGTQQRACSLD